MPMPPPPSVSAETGQSLPKLFCRMTATFPVGWGSQFVTNLHVRCHSQEMQYCRRGCFPARPPILVRRWLLICRPRRRREARPAGGGDRGLAVIQLGKGDFGVGIAAGQKNEGVRRYGCPH